MHPLVAIVKRDWHNQSHKVLFIFAAIFFYLGLYAVTEVTDCNIVGWLTLLLCLGYCAKNIRNLASCYCHHLGFTLPNYGYYQFVISVAYSLVMFTFSALLFAVNLSHGVVLVAAFYVLAAFLYVFSTAITLSLIWTWLAVLIVLMSSSLFEKGLEGLLKWLNGIEMTMQIAANTLSNQPLYMFAYLLGCGILILICLTFGLWRHQVKREYHSALLPLSWRQNNQLSALSGSLAQYRLLANLSRGLSHFITGKSALEKICYLDRDERVFYVTFFLLLFGVLGFIGFMLPKNPNPEGVIIPLAIFFCFFTTAIYSSNSVGFLKKKTKFAYCWLTQPANKRQTYMNGLVTLLTIRLLRSMLLFATPIILMTLFYSGYKLSLLVLLSAMVVLLPSLLLQIGYSLLVTMTMQPGNWLRYQTVIFAILNIMGGTLLSLWVFKTNPWLYIGYPLCCIGVAMVMLRYWQCYALEAK